MEAKIVDLNPSTTTAQVIQQELPSWYRALIEEVTARARGVANEPYQPYTGPRIQPFVPAQLQSFQTVQNAQGAWSPYFGQSVNTLNAALGMPSAMSATSPFYAGAAGVAGQDTTGGYLGAGTGDIDQSVGMSGLGAASPYLGAASQTFPGAVSSYMNPYTSQVLDVLAQRAGQNLEENLMPAVRDQFVGHGQFGSERNREFANRALRDTQRDLLQAQSLALQSGYNTAGQLFGQDQARLAQLASTAGGLTGADAQRLLAAAQARANLAGAALGETGQDINTMLGIGQGLQGALGQDINNLRNIAQQQFNLGQGLQGLSYADAAALGAVGQQQQQLGQTSLDTAYQDFLEQRGYPQSMTTYLSNIIRGYNPGTNSTTTTTQPATANQLQPSTISQLAGVGTGLLGLGGAFGLFRAKGGRVVAPDASGLGRRSYKYPQRPSVADRRRQARRFPAAMMASTMMG